MYDLALRHDPRPPFAYPLASEHVRVRLRTALDDPRRPVVEYSDRQDWRGPDESVSMRWLCDTAPFRFWTADLAPFEGRVRYTFRLDPPSGSPNERPMWLGESGVSAIRPGAEWPDGYFHFPYLHGERLMSTPAWVRDAVCYEIFPDRFARGSISPHHHLPDWWPEHPGHDIFWGGDLTGILERLPYIAALGVNMLWLTPIFASPTNHKYDTSDYGRIDPGFGTEETFAQLVGTAHRDGIRIILDGVFNHSGMAFAPWQDVLSHGRSSPYWGWFDIRGDQPDLHARNYRTFAHTAYMPRLMTGNPEVQAYLIEHALRWTRMGTAGWRLDVADEVDVSFWRAFRREVRSANPDSYFVGEIAYDASRWLEGDQFDGVMNYPLRRAMLQFFAAPRETTGAPPPAERLDADGFLNTLGQLRSWYPGWATTAMLNPLSTHDVPRFFTACGEDERRWRLGLIFLMAYEGIPLLYYGDEVGLKGGYDPDCRRPMIWEPERYNAAMLAATRQMIRLRREHEALRSSGLRRITTGSPHIVAFVRGSNGLEELVEQTGALPDDAALIVLNRSEAAVSLHLDLSTEGECDRPHWPETAHVCDVLTDTTYSCTTNQLDLTIPPLDARVLVPEGAGKRSASGRNSPALSAQ